MPAAAAAKGPVRRRSITDGAVGMLKATSKADGSNACTQLTATFVFFAIFFLAQLEHHRAGIAFQLTKTFTSYLNSVNSAPAGPPGVPYDPYTIALDDVNSPAYLFDWLQMTFVPPLWAEQPGGKGLLKGANRVIGGVRIRQQRFRTGECPGAQGRQRYVSWYNASCYSEELDKSAMAFGPSTQAADETFYHNYWLDLDQSLNGTQAHLKHLKDSNWLSLATKQVKVESVFYNGELGMFIMLGVSFDQKRTGQIAILKSVEFLPELVYQNGWASLSLWADVLVFIALGALTLLEIYLLVMACRSSNLKAHLTVYKVATLGLVLGGLIIQFFFVWLSNNLQGVYDMIPGLVESQGNVEANGYKPGVEHSGAVITYHAKLDELYSAVEYFAWALRYSQLGTFWYSLLLLFKFMEGFQANEKLSTLVKMFRLSIMDLFYFFLIFIIVFINFALGAHLLFGHKLKEWSGVIRSFNAGFRALMGDFDQQSLYAIAPTSSTVWFWLYMIVIYLVLMNVFIAIILEGFARAQPPPEQRDGSSILTDMRASIGQFFMKSQKVKPADAPEETTGDPVGYSEDGGVPAVT